MPVGKLLRQGLAFANVVANGVATAMITPGRTIEGLLLVMGGTTFSSAHVSMIRVKANSKVIWEASGAEADKLAKFHGHSYPATIIPVMFVEVFGRDLLDEMLGAFDTSQGVNSLAIEVTIAGATAPTLDLYLIESQPQPDKVNQKLSKVLRVPWNISSGGKLQVQIPYGNTGTIIKRLHIQHGVANNITAVSVKEDAVLSHESVKAVNDAFNQFMRSTIQTNVYTVDFMADENVRNCMDTRKDRSLELLLTCGAADSGTILVECLDELENL
jgi:hypothetical protein